MYARTLLASVGFLVLVSTPAAAGTILASAAIPVSLDDDYKCTVVNAGTKELAAVTVVVSKAGAGFGSGVTDECMAVAGAAECTAATSAGSDGDRFCSVTLVGGSAKVVRGRFCNLSTGECADLR